MTDEQSLQRQERDSPERLGAPRSSEGLTDEIQERQQEKLLDAANEASRHVQRVYATFLLIAVYIATTVGSTTHEQLLRVGNVTLPLLNVALPIIGFYLLIPWLLFLLHFNLLLQFYLLAQKLHPLEEQPGLRRLVYPLLLSHMLLRKQYGFGLHLLLGFVIFVTVAFLPMLLLGWMQLGFLPYHDEAITWSHRAAVVADLLLLWVMWPIIENPKSSWSNWWVQRIEGTRRGRLGVVLSGFLGVIVIVFSFYVGAIPEGRDWRDKLISRNLNVTELTLVGKAPSPELLAAYAHKSQSDNWKLQAWLEGAESLDLRGRDLRFANFRKAKLYRADFRGANLKGAKFEDAELVGANFSPLGEKPHFQSNRERLSLGPLIKTNLQNADFSSAQLQGADLSNAKLQGTNLSFSKLNGADLYNAQLQATDLRNAELQGAYLSEANMQGVNLVYANLRGADLRNAKLLGANLSNARLEGAYLTHAKLKGASLRKSRLNATDVTMADFSLTDLRRLHLQPFKEWDTMATELKDTVPAERRVSMLRRLEAAKNREVEVETQKIALKGISLVELCRLQERQAIYVREGLFGDCDEVVSEKKYHKTLAEFYGRLACGDKHLSRKLLHELISSYFLPERDFEEALEFGGSAFLIAEGLSQDILNASLLDASCEGIRQMRKSKYEKEALWALKAISENPDLKRRLPRR